jgi:hypothetical protein
MILVIVKKTESNDVLSSICHIMNIIDFFVLWCY